MEQIGALDANFLYTETKSVRNHIASVQIVKVPEGQSTEQFIAGLKSVISDRLHLVPYLTRKLRFLPGNIDHPFWVRDTNFDINDHIYEVALDPLAPSDDSFRKLEERIAQIHAKPMDRSKPLWSLQVITGFEEGKVAYYNQMHHACVDGVSGQLAIRQLMDPSQDVRILNEASLASAADKVPSLLELFSKSTENLLCYQAGNQGRLLGQLESMARLGQRAIDPSKQLGALTMSAPRTRFNRSIQAQRSYTAGELPLDLVKRIGKALDCKVNDVFMAIVAGGLRTYLQRLGELPERGLIAGCPVSLRQPGDDSLCNQVTMMKVNLATHLADPALRLLAVRNSAQTAKDVTMDLSHGLVTNVSLPGLPASIIAAANWAEASQSANYLTPQLNVVISNIPGPRETLYSNGAQVLTHYPVSVPAHGIGVNITVQSYVDHLYFAITACKQALPDEAVLKADIYTAFEELRNLLLPDSLLANKDPDSNSESVARSPLQPFGSKAMNLDSLMIKKEAVPGRKLPIGKKVA